MTLNQASNDTTAVIDRIAPKRGYHQCTIDWDHMAIRLAYISTMRVDQVYKLHKMEEERFPVMGINGKRADEGCIFTLMEIRRMYHIRPIKPETATLEMIIEKIKLHVPGIERCMEWSNSVTFIHAWDDAIVAASMTFPLQIRKKSGSNYDAVAEESEEKQWWNK
jgi:hypothetical protein